MPGSCRYRLRPATGAMLAACAMLVILPGPARAQNLLESLINALGGRTQPASVQARDANPNAWDFLDRAESAAPRGSAASYCVRMCDGRYFPLPRRAGNVAMNSAQICQAMCPAAETRVFNGTAIERAVSDDGKAYASIKTAFLYRDKTVSNCSCKAGGGDGVAALDAKDDPTLRRGDIVVTRDGPMVFTGERRGEGREQAFVRPDDYRGLPMSLRKEIAEIQVAKDTSETAMLPAGAAPASHSARPATAVSYTPPAVRAASASTPVAEAFASFKH